MFKFKLDEKWLKSSFDEINKDIPRIITERLKHTTEGVIQDLVHQAIREEMQKPEHKERLVNLAKEIISDENAAQLIKRLLYR